MKLLYLALIFSSILAVKANNIANLENQRIEIKQKIEEANQKPWWQLWDTPWFKAERRKPWEEKLADIDRKINLEKQKSKKKTKWEIASDWLKNVFWGKK